MNHSKDNVLFLFTCAALTGFFTLLPQPLRAEAWFDNLKLAHIGSLREDITLLNLINGLLLDESQIQKLIITAKKAQREYDLFQENTYPIQNDYYQKLQILKNHLSHNQIIPDDLEKSITILEKEYKSNKHLFMQKIKIHEADTGRYLNASQLNTIEDFQPCTIPPKDLSQPTRAGQATSNFKGIENMLDTARRLSQNAYENYVDTFLSNMLSEFELHLGRMSDEEKQQEHQRLKNILGRARLLTDADFLVQRDQLVLEIVEKYHTFINTIKALEKETVRFHGGLSKVSRYLLNPRIIPLLKSPLAAIQTNSRLINRNKYATHHVQKSSSDHVPKGKEQKKSFNDFFRLIKLNQQQRKQVKPILIEGQKELWSVLVRSRPDRIQMIQEFENIKQSSVSESMKMVKLLELLSLKIPNEDQTYMERMNNIKTNIHVKFKQILSQEQFIKYKTSQIDIFDLESKK